MNLVLYYDSGDLTQLQSIYLILPVLIMSRVLSSDNTCLITINLYTHCIKLSECYYFELNKK